MAKNGLFRKTIKRANVQQILKPIFTQSAAVSTPVAAPTINASFTQNLISTLVAATGHLTLLPRTGILSKFLSNVSLNALGSISGVAYDTSIGNGVDANGFANLPLHPGARYIFVGNGGSDGNTGLSHAQRLATIAAAWSMITQSHGDQVLLAEGSVFPEAFPWMAFIGGFSPLFPTVIQSYDPLDPLNTAKYGRGDQRNARPILTSPQTLVSGGTFSYIAVRGIEFNPGNVSNSGLEFRGNFNYALFENNIFAYTGLSLDTAVVTPYPPTASKIIVRNNSLYSMWSTGGRTGGIYVAGYDGPTLEDNVFYHCGWKDGASRIYSGPADESSPEYNAWVAAGGPTVFSHSYYIQTSTRNAIVRRNLSIEGSGDGGIARGDSMFSENLFIDNPAAIGLGGGPNYNTDRPDGVTFTCYNNGIIGSTAVPFGASGWGINTTNGLPGSRVYNNLMVNSPYMGSGNESGFSNGAFFDQPSYAQYDHNLIWNWVSQADQPHSYYAAGGVFPAQSFATYDYNNWDGTPLGTNTNSTATVFPNAYTAAQLYIAEGYADRDAFVNYAIRHPEAHIQRSARVRLFTGYGM